MTAIELTFIVLSISVVLYLLFAIVYHKRVPLVTEIVYSCVYLISALLFFFPRTWGWLDGNFGVQLALNLILVMAVFFLFAGCVRLYQKSEKMRQEITTLARDIALAQSKVDGKKKI